LDGQVGLGFFRIALDVSEMSRCKDSDAANGECLEELTSAIGNHGEFHNA
jgi:hypothetical protein